MKIGKKTELEKRAKEVKREEEVDKDRICGNRKDTTKRKMEGEEKGEKRRERIVISGDLMFPYQVREEQLASRKKERRKRKELDKKLAKLREIEKQSR